jgi:ubiquitin carboxyl-terminal hydrolase 14
MTLIPIIVKWGKEVFELQFDPTTGSKSLKLELQERTHVPMERMKLMAKSKHLWKGVLKDDTVCDWHAAWQKQNGPLQLLCMGSATPLVEPPAGATTVFVEDLPPEQVAMIQEPSGLVNLGNTCYLNSVVQCLRVIRPLRDALHPADRGTNPTTVYDMSLARSLKTSLEQMDRQTEASAPHLLVRATKVLFPQFAQTGPHGQPLQQDAEEFYSQVLQKIASELPGSTSDSHDNVVDSLFGLDLEETLTCSESPDEPPVVSHDWHRKLVCNIQGGSDTTAQTNVTHIAEGIRLSLNGSMEKQSDLLGRNAVWTRAQRLARLPSYLTVQFGRFYWKATPESQDHAGVKCKVMKPVAFQGTLDVYEFCNPAIQSILQKHRTAARLLEQAKETLGGTESASTEDATMTDAAEDPDLAAALLMSVASPDDETAEDTSRLEATMPLPQFQGYYELFAVVTHKGRDADGGHYMAWVKADHQGNVAKIADSDEANEDWYVFDDDEVSSCKTEDVLKLKGGGDWHMSYLNFYRAKR